MAWPMVCPTAEPTATPAAVVAIWANMPGCLGAAAGAAMALGGAWVGTGAYEGGGAALAIGRGGARLAGGDILDVRLLLPLGIVDFEKTNSTDISLILKRAAADKCSAKYNSRG